MLLMPARIAAAFIMTDPQIHVLIIVPFAIVLTSFLDVLTYGDYTPHDECIKIITADLKGEIIAVRDDYSSFEHTPQTCLALLAGADPISTCFPETSNSFNTCSHASSVEVWQIALRRQSHTAHLNSHHSHKFLNGASIWAFPYVYTSSL